MKKFFCLLALSACVFGCQKQQAKEEGSAEGQGRAKLSERERALIESKQETVSHVIPVSMQQIDQEPTNEQQPAEEIENRPTPAKQGDNAERRRINKHATGSKHDSRCDGDSNFITDWDTDARAFIHAVIDRANARGWQKTSRHFDAALAP